MDRRSFLAAVAAFGLAGCESIGAQGLKIEPPAPHRDPDVPYVPTRQEVVEAMLKMAGVKAADVVYDLGCGDGRIVIAAAQRFGARGVGIDINPTRISEARYNARRAGVEKQVEFQVGDLFEADIREATVVTLYLLPDVNLRLKPKLQRDLRPGTRIVSHDFSMGPDWPAERTEKIGNSTVFFWTIR
jgi:ubiquinone/menaquinone biosynthesis C-methylase UbiE